MTAPETPPAAAVPPTPPAPELWLTTYWGVIESDESGAWRTVENGSFVAELPADAVRLVPDDMELFDANEKLGEALVEIGMALGLGRPTVGNTWGRTEILAAIRSRPPRDADWVGDGRAGWMGLGGGCPDLEADPTGGRRTYHLDGVEVTEDEIRALRDSLTAALTWEDQGTQEDVDD